MKWSWHSWVTITSSEINADMETHLAPTKDIIKKRFLLFNFNSLNIHGIFSILTQNFEMSWLLAIFNLTICCGTYTSFFMIATLIVFIKLESNFTVVFCSSKSIGVCHDRGPQKTASTSLLSALTLVSCLEAWSVLISSTNCKEERRVIVYLTRDHEFTGELAPAFFLFFTSDFDGSSVRSLWVW